jgi:molybdopterin/thiamine biosynthesis adenylyltransferase
MSEVVVGEEVWTRLSELTATPVESGAALFLRYDRAGDRYLVHHLMVASGENCLAATATEFTYAPQFLSRATRLARQGDYHLALFHTHPSGFPDFSVRDDDTEEQLASFMSSRLPDHEVFSLMMCDARICGRRLGTSGAIGVRRVGPWVQRFGVVGEVTEADETFDRQVRAFGEDGQAILSSMSVAIVGLGGTGSLVAQQLAHLGVGSLILVDDDAVDPTNLNRVVGTTPDSVGDPKVDVARTLIQAIRPGMTVRTLAASVRLPEGRDLLCQADCIMVCTDSHVSRAFINDLAYQYLVPAIDMGVSISVTDGVVTAVTGRTQMLAPGLPCLWCTNAISARAIREELQSPAERAADPYFQGGGIRQPAVISLNSTAASLAVTMLLGAFTNVPIGPRYQIYDALKGTVRPFAFRAEGTCGVCGEDGIAALGDHRPLPLLQLRGAP